VGKRRLQFLGRRQRVALADLRGPWRGLVEGLTPGCDIGSSVKRMPVAFATALAMVAMGARWALRAPQP